MLVHDGILFELDNEEQVQHAIEIMRIAGREVCGGLELVALHSDSDGLGPTVRLARAGVSDQRGPRCCEESLAAF